MNALLRSLCKRCPRGQPSCSVLRSLHDKPGKEEGSKEGSPLSPQLIEASGTQLEREQGGKIFEKKKKHDATDECIMIIFIFYEA